MPTRLTCTLPPKVRSALAANIGPRWLDHAACGTQDGQLFEGTSPAAVGLVNEALAQCQACPVMIPCRARALLYREKGVWGGCTAEDRKVMLADLEQHGASAVREVLIRVPVFT